MRNQALAIGLGVIVAAGACAPAAAQTRPAEQLAAGFYGGVALRQATTEATGVNVGSIGPAWGRFTSPMAADDSASRSLFFGGYRWNNDIAVEAAFNTSDRITLRPDDPSARRGVGLSLQPPDASPRQWNADVFTSWSFLRRFALYGRLGYAQALDAPAPNLATLPAADTRRGMNYGVGMRYDVNRTLGLRLEYARFGRFAGETVQSGILPDSDQVQLGVQLRF
jgi:opacity protein-like surface antigen